MQRVSGFRKRNQRGACADRACPMCGGRDDGHGWVRLQTDASRPAAEFDVASIKPNGLDFPIRATEEVAWATVRFRAGIALDSIPLRGLIQLAYEVWGYQYRTVLRG